MENNNSQFDPNKVEGSMNTTEMFGASTQSTQPEQNPFGAPTQSTQPGQNPFRAPMQSTQPEQNPFGAPTQSTQPGQNPFRAPMQSTQPEQNPFGAPMQNEFNNVNNLPLINLPKKSKKGLFITLITIITIVVLVLMAGIGVFVYNAFNKSNSGESSTSKKSEFILDANSSDSLSFKMKEIKRDVKVKKELTNATVYVFEVENTGSDSTDIFSLTGLSKDGALVKPVYEDDVENSTILEDNNCKTTGTELKKDEKSRICLVYPISVAKLLVPERKNKAVLYRPVNLDSEAQSSNEFLVENKKKGDSLSTKNYEKKVKTSTIFSDVKEVEDTYGRSISVIEATLSIKEDNKYATKDYGFLLVELEDGTYYYEAYSDYKIEGTLSDQELSKKILDPVKKGDELKYTIVFPKGDKKIKNLIAFKIDSEKQTDVTNVFAV